MVTIHREGGFRFFFYSNEHAPAHVHVERNAGEAKFNLLGENGGPELVEADGLKKSDIRRAMAIVEENVAAFLERWMEIDG